MSFRRIFERWSWRFFQWQMRCGLVTCCMKADAPDYAAANKEARDAFVETLPIELQTRLKYQPQFDALEFASQERAMQAFVDAMMGDPNDPNARPGLLDRQYEADLKYAPKFLELDLQHAKDSAMGMAEAELAIQEQLGDRFLESALGQAKKADPYWFETRDQVGKQVLEELALGGQLTDSQRRNAEQSVRGAQAARGNVLGPAASLDEALAKFDVGEQMRQKRLGNAMAFLGGQQPGSQMAGVQQAQGGAAPFNPLQRQSTFTAGQQSFNPAQNVWDRAGINNASGQIYNTQFQANSQNAQMMNDMVGGMMGMAGGAMMMCWVAREVYGKNDPRWRQVREWMLNDAPDDLAEAYARYGEDYADYIRDKPKLKARWRSFFDRVLQQQTQLERLGLN